MAPVVYGFCRQAGERFRPAVGRGAAQQRTQWYHRPTQTGSIVKHIGEGFHLNLLPTEHLKLVEIDADHWKTWVHQRLSAPLDQPGAMTFFQATPQYCRVRYSSCKRRCTRAAQGSQAVSTAT